MTPNERDPEPRRSFCRGLLPVALLVLAPSLLFAPVWRGWMLGPVGYQNALLPWGEWHQTEQGPGWNALMADWVLQYYPWRAFARESLRAGEVPLWNPHQLCGMPFQANGQSAVFYPPNLLFWLLPLHWGFGLSAIGHLALAGLLAYGFARRELGVSAAGALLSGLAYQLCGFLVAWTPMTAAMNVLAWLPGGLWAAGALVRGAGRRWYCVAGAAGMMLLAGHLQFAYYGLLATLGYALVGAAATWRRDRRAALGIVGGLLAGLACGAAVAAIQILPTMELARANHRPAERSAEALAFLHAWALHRESAAALFTMAPYGNPSQGTWRMLPQNYAEICGVTGVGTVLLALLGFAARRSWREWFLAALAAVSLAVAFATPLADLLYRVLPGFSRFAGLPRILCLWSLAVALLGGAGYDQLARCRADAALRARAMRLLAAGAAVLAAVVLSSVTRVAGLVPGASSAMLPDLLLFCIVGAVVVAGLAASLARPAEVALVAVVAGELLLTGFGYNQAFPPERLSSPHPAIEALRSQAAWGRVLALTGRWGFSGPREAALPPNTATALGLRDVQGYDSLMPRWIKHGAAQAGGGVASPEINGNMVLLGERDPRRLVPRALSERGMAAVLAGPSAATLLESMGFHRTADFGTCAVLAPGIAPQPIPVHEGPNRMVSRDRPPESGPIVRESYDRGWVARSPDGRRQETALDPETGFLRVRVEPSLELRLSYEPGPYAVGGFVSLLAAGLLAAVGGWAVARRREVGP